MPNYRILVLDGRNGDRVIKLLRHVDEQLLAAQQDTPIINQVDLFGGTSFGGLNALFFAMHEHPADALAEIDTFWEKFTHEVRSPSSLERMMTRAWGVSAFLATDKLQHFLTAHFGQSTLGDLPGKVALVSLKLDNGEEEPYREWEPVIFHNLLGSPYLGETLVDVAMRTCALPLVNPIFQSVDGTGPGYVDGAVVADNPALMVLTQALDVAPLEDITLFSVGVERNVIGQTVYLDPKFEDGNAKWGYREWLMDPTKPLLLLDIFLHGSSAGATMQCQKLLKDRFFRLGPDLVTGDLVLNPQTMEEIEQAAAWLSASQWVATAVPAPPTPEPTVPEPTDEERVVPFDFQRINGIGEAREQDLYEAGILTLQDFLDTSSERLGEILRLSEENVASLIAQAQGLA